MGMGMVRPKEVHHVTHTTKVIEDCDKGQQMMMQPPQQYYAPPMQMSFQQPQAPQLQMQPQNVVIRHVMDSPSITTSSLKEDYGGRMYDLDVIERRFDEHRRRALEDIMGMLDVAGKIAEPGERAELEQQKAQVRRQMSDMFDNMKSAFMQALEEKKKVLNRRGY